MPKWFQSNRSSSEESSWGLTIKSPPEEAYGRLTNIERFRPLHSTVLEIVALLEEQFEVDRTEAYGLDHELVRGLEHADFGIARPDVSLIPSDPDAAPIVVAFTTFPGLYVRFGRWYTETFPSCGCDACHESVEYEIERLEEMVDNVTAGRFREAIRRPLLSFTGSVWNETKFWSPNGGYSEESGSMSRVDKRRAREIFGRRRRLDLNWKPWRHKEIATAPTPYKTGPCGRWCAGARAIPELRYRHRTRRRSSL